LTKKNASQNYHAGVKGDRPYCGRVTDDVKNVTSLGCIGIDVGCRVMSGVGEQLEANGPKVTKCSCNTKLCNGADGTLSTSLIIAIIVGAIFFH